MSPAYLAERRALYAAVAAATDRHIGPRHVDPRVHHSAHSSTGMSDSHIWRRDYRDGRWSCFGIDLRVRCLERRAVVDDFGDLVEVAP